MRVLSGPDALRIEQVDAAGDDLAGGNFPAVCFDERTEPVSRPLVRELDADGFQDFCPQVLLAVRRPVNEGGADEHAAVPEHAVYLGEDFRRIRHDVQGVRNDNDIEGLVPVAQVCCIGNLEADVRRRLPFPGRGL